MTPAAKDKVQRPNLLDPMQIALEVTELRGEQAALQQHLNSSVQGLTSAVQAVQGDLRGLQNGQTQMLDEMHSMREHGSGLERLAKAIEKLAADNERRWEVHEVENQKVADAVTHNRGAMKTAILVAGLVFTLVSVIATMSKTDTSRQFSDAAEQRLRIENEHDVDIARVEKRLDRIEAGAKESRDREGVAQ